MNVLCFIAPPRKRLQAATRQQKERRIGLLDCTNGTDLVEASRFLGFTVKQHYSSCGRAFTCRSMSSTHHCRACSNDRIGRYPAGLRPEVRLAEVISPIA